MPTCTVDVVWRGEGGLVGEEEEGTDGTKSFSQVRIESAKSLNLKGDSQAPSAPPGQ